MKANYLKLHFIVLIFGFTAIIGKQVSLVAVDLVWYRLFIAVGALFVMLRFKHVKLKVSWAMLGKLLLIGVVVGIHWASFYHAIKISNVSIALSSMATGTLFTSLLEPLFYKRKISIVEVVLGLCIIAGLLIIYQAEQEYTLGILYGLLAAFTSSLFTVLNGRLAGKEESLLISFYEMIGALLLLSVVILARTGEQTFTWRLNLEDLVLLLILGVVCTAYAFNVSVEIMKELNPFIVVLTINLEPIYGILLSLAFFGESEFMSTGFYLGTVILLACVFSYPWYLKKKKERQALIH